jgi:putative hydrolase of the HAD superfamily
MGSKGVPQVGVEKMKTLPVRDADTGDGESREDIRYGVFFDLYGTLIDIRTDEYNPWVYATLSQYLSYFGVSIPPEELRSRYFGGAESYLKQSPERYPEVDVFAVFRDIMTSYGRLKYTKEKVMTVSMLFRSLTRQHFDLFPDVHEVLDSLKERYRMAIVSDAQWVFTEPELEMTGIGEFFRVRVLSSRVGFKKPDTRIFLRAMKALRIRPEHALYIGDNPPKDLVGAKTSGMKCIIFRTPCSEYNGFHPDACFQHFTELSPLIDEIFSKTSG